MVERVVPRWGEGWREGGSLQGWESAGAQGGAGEGALWSRTDRDTVEPVDQCKKKNDQPIGGWKAIHP